MLGKRLSEPRRAISVYDPAFLEFGAKVRDEYLITRDIDLLGDLSAMPNPPTVVTLEPARPEHQHLLARDDMETLTALFRMYAVAIEHGAPLQVEEVNGVRRLTDDCVASFGWEVAAEWGGLVQQFARCDTTPFTPPGGYEATARTMLLQRAMAFAQSAAHSDTDESTATD
jgi:hypothetical protein